MSEDVGPADEPAGVATRARRPGAVVGHGAAAGDGRAGRQHGGEGKDGSGGSDARRALGHAGCAVPVVPATISWSHAAVAVPVGQGG
ncbi:hypothetical protein [Streptomyces sp. NPDC059063]|uniref:hypothetical protein n=1 Tax=unclassified Streptomyces TaxID=2593676 RepID=UPI003675F731